MTSVGSVSRAREGQGQERAVTPFRAELWTPQGRTLTAGCGELNEGDLPSNRILHSFLKILESSSICLSMAAEWALAPWSSLLEAQLPMV